ncbi:hypothetical protein E2562_036096 [Oryza meyeriana var. granulata]|uniref:Uncharacterized protein n=1 Tax=Oryza meyeriana var. granulata TaxID=110450 RepID=A0A6G1DS03_9ORYZ|nr:hypothetical protein E2562_036096 [Oryza meyeriana var. granulata]
MVFLAEGFVTSFGYEQNPEEWPILRRWDVPWEWQTVVLTMVGCGVRRKIQQKPLSNELIRPLDINKYDPWDLPNF